MDGIERTLILLKPDALQRDLLGAIISRFERKGLKIVGMKLINLSDELLDEHYSHHVGKGFFDDLNLTVDKIDVRQAEAELISRELQVLQDTPIIRRRLL